MTILRTLYLCLHIQIYQNFLSAPVSSRGTKSGQDMSNLQLKCLDINHNNKFCNSFNKSCTWDTNLSFLLAEQCSGCLSYSINICLNLQQWNHLKFMSSSMLHLQMHLYKLVSSGCSLPHLIKFNTNELYFTLSTVIICWLSMTKEINTL
jgi:hypothetical protein